jgi:hypothetical protein
MLVAFTIEVFLAVVHPMAHRVHVNRLLVVKVVVIAWILIVFYSTVYFLTLSGLVDNLCYLGFNLSPASRLGKWRVANLN